MVMSFFRRGEPGLTHITTHIVSMLGDARHSFDVATSAVLSGGDPTAALDEVRVTDDRINRTEGEIRRELIVHASVHGTADIGVVLAYSLLVKKVERIGDQAKNIMDLAIEGVSLADADDLTEFLEARRTISELFADVAELLLEPDESRATDIRARTASLRVAHERRIRELVHSDRPGHWAVPRAVLHRYLKRIVANLEGVTWSVEDTDADPAIDADT